MKVSKVEKTVIEFDERETELLNALTDCVAWTSETELARFAEDLYTALPYTDGDFDSLRRGVELNPFQED